MAKTKKNVQQAQSTSRTTPRSPAPAASSRKRRKSRVKVSDKVFPPYVQLVVNPLYAPLTNAFPPGASTRPSLMWRTAFSSIHTPDASGNLLLAFTAGTYRSQIPLVLTSGAVSTVPTGTSWVDHTTIAASFSYYRPVALVIEMEYVGQSDLAAGIMFAAQSEVGPYTGLSIASLIDEPYYTEANIVHNEKVCAVVRFPSLDTSYPIAYDSTALAQIWVGTQGAATGTGSIRVKGTLVGEYQAAASSLFQTQALYSPSHAAAQSTAECLVGPAVSCASGDEPYSYLEAASKKMAHLGARLNNLFATGEDVSELLATMAAVSTGVAVARNMRLTL